MPIHLDIPKRHSDPAPCTGAAASRSQTTYARSVPDLRSVEYSGGSPFASPSRSPQALTPRATPTASPARQPSRRSRQAKYRRLSQGGSGGGGYASSPNPSYFSTTPRRATHPNTSPRRFRRGSLWLDDEPDPWLQFRLKGCTLPNSEDKTFVSPSEIDPTTAVELGCYRMRSFSVTSKGVVNLGDFLRVRSHSDASMTSDGSSSGVEHDFRDRLSSVESTTSTTCTRYRVLLLGAEGVGKSSLVAQFMTSECLTTITDTQTSIDGSQERTVSMLVDGEESELTCEDPSDSTFEVDESVFSITDAFLVVFSVTESKTFAYAHRILHHLRELGDRGRYLCPGVIPKVVILVANKVDLVRCRVVSVEEGRSLADKYDIKYIETSVGFNHNVDELLVGIMTQIQLKARQMASLSSSRTIVAKSMKLTYKARGLMDRLLQKCDLKTRSCDNLNVL